jgi:hypothetical protein
MKGVGAPAASGLKNFDGIRAMPMRAPPIQNIFCQVAENMDEKEAQGPG